MEWWPLGVAATAHLSSLRGINGCNLEPPQDVAHVQFRSRQGVALQNRQQIHEIAIKISATLWINCGFIMFIDPGLTLYRYTVILHTFLKRQFIAKIASEIGFSEMFGSWCVMFLLHRTAFATFSWSFKIRLVACNLKLISCGLGIWRWINTSIQFNTYHIATRCQGGWTDPEHPRTICSNARVAFKLVWCPPAETLVAGGNLWNGGSLSRRL